MRTYTKLVGELYHWVNFGELPALRTHDIAFMSYLFLRKSKDEVLMNHPGV